MKVKLDEEFQVWFKKTNPHLFKKKLNRQQMTKEVEEYVNDVLLEHIEQMEYFMNKNNNDDNRNQ